MRRLRKISVLLLVAVLAMVMTASAGAALLSVPKTSDFENCKPVGTPTADGFTMTGKLGVDDVMTVHIYLLDDAADAEFWNNSKGYIEYDVRLDTEVKAHALMPGFATGWSWVGPTNYNVKLAYNEWVTVSEPMTNYYKNGFLSKGPLSVLVQVVGDESTAKDATVSVRNIRFVGVDGTETPATTTTVATTTTAATTTTTESEPVESEPEEVQPVEGALWQGEKDLIAWNENVQITAAQLADVKEGDVINIGYEVLDASSPQIKVAAMAGNWDSLTSPDNVDPEWGVIPATEGTLSFALNAEDAAAISTYGMAISGQQISIKSVAVEAGEPAEEPEESTPEESEPAESTTTAKTTAKTTEKTTAKTTKATTANAPVTTTDEGDVVVMIIIIIVVAVVVVAAAVVGYIIYRKKKYY